MVSRNPPSVIRIIWVDYWAFLGFLFAIVPWFVLAILMITQAPTRAIFMVLVVSMTALGFMAMVWRILTIVSIFNDGIAVPAVIHGVWYFRDRGRVEYIYSYHGEKYIGGSAIHKSRYTRFLESQVHVTALVDRNNPRRAIIQELYV